jgi:hypothetical protein
MIGIYVLYLINVGLGYNLGDFSQTHLVTLETKEWALSPWAGADFTPVDPNFTPGGELLF